MAAADFEARIKALCPDFSAAGPARRIRAMEIVVGRVGDVPVVGKRLAAPDATAAWLFAREHALYRAFAAAPPAVRVPRLVAAADDAIVLERLAGEPLASQRRPHAVLPIRTVAALLAAIDALAEWSHAPALQPAPPRVRAHVAERMAELPGDATSVRDAVRLAARRGLLADPAARTIDDALARYPQGAFAHGNLVLRDAIADDDDAVALVDWTCAGVHPRDWDRALLWTQLAPPARGLVEDAVRDSGGRWRAFLGLVAFALVRELRFDVPVTERAAITADLDAAIAQLA